MAAPKLPKLPSPAPGGAANPTAKLRPAAELSPETRPAAAACGDAAGGVSSATVPPAAAELPPKPEPAKVKRAAKPEPPAKPKAKAQPAKKPEPPAAAKRPRPPAPKPKEPAPATPDAKAAARRAAPLETLDAPKTKLGAQTPTAEKLEAQSHRQVASAAAAPVPDKSVPDKSVPATAELASSDKPLRSRRGLGSLGKQAFNRAAPALQLLPRPHLPLASTPVRPASAGQQVGDAASLIAQARSLSGGAAGPAGRHKDPVAFLRDELLALLALIEEPPEPPPNPHGSG